ncbi:MAG TPA: CotS family spore coat protein, partial [Clostridium sp.]
YYNEVNWGQGTFATKLQGIINEQEKFLKLLGDFKEEYQL